MIRASHGSRSDRRILFSLITYQISFLKKCPHIPVWLLSQRVKFTLKTYSKKEEEYMSNLDLHKTDTMRALRKLPRTVEC